MIFSEPWMTEFAAIYLGKQAYDLETAAYKAKIREQFVKGQEYQSWHGKKELDFAPAFQKLQQLFSTNTWRSWRTFGMSGGMIPWNDGHGWEISEAGQKKGEYWGISTWSPRSLFEASLESSFELFAARSLHCSSWGRGNYEE